MVGDGQRLLLCTDGLSDLVNETKLCELLALEDPDEAATALLRAALDAGGRDNVTIAIVEL